MHVTGPGKSIGSRAAAVPEAIETTCLDAICSGARSGCTTTNPLSNGIRRLEKPKGEKR